MQDMVDELTSLGHTGGVGAPIVLKSYNDAVGKLLERRAMPGNLSKGERWTNIEL